jgi:putative ABC transport system permease protein
MAPSRGRVHAVLPAVDKSLMMDALLQDVRYALRMLRHDVGFAVVTILCLGLAIGANTTIFSVVNAVLLRPFPYADPNRIVALHAAQPRNGVSDALLSLADYRDFRDGMASVSDAGAYTWRSLVLGSGAEPERVSGAMVSARLFPLLGVSPMMGRTFREDEDRVGAPPVVLLGYGLWRRRFAGDANIIGQTVLVDGRAHTVVGVMPPRFRFPLAEDAWVPVTPLTEMEPRSARRLRVLLRLRPSVTALDASHEAAAVANRLAALYPQTNAGWAASIRPLRDEMVPPKIQTVVIIMMGAVGFVLLIACANLANLLLARAAGRTRETAVRSALGASRARLSRQYLTESVLLALLGGAFGVGVAIVWLRLIQAAMPPDQIPYWIVLSIDGWVLGFTLLTAVGTGVAFGLAPAVQLSPARLAESIKDGSAGAGVGAHRSRIRQGLVVAQLALALVLLVGAALFVRSFLALSRSDGGFATNNLLTVRTFLPGESYETAAQRTRRAAELVRGLETLPGVAVAAASNTVPLSGGGTRSNVQLEGRSAAPGEEPRVYFTGVTSGFFNALGLRVMTGRGFTEQEASDSSGVALVNRTFATRYWPASDALGQRFRFVDDSSRHWLTVIGVVPDIMNGPVDDEAEPSAYLPLPYYTVRNTGFVIRTRTDPTALVGPVREQVHAIDPGLPVFEMLTMEELRRSGFWQYQLFGWMFATFGGIALFLACLGIFGVLAHTVGQRSREIGIRLALGAQPPRVLALVLRQGLQLAASGVGLGLLGSLALARALRSVLFKLDPLDPISFSTVTIMLLIVALIATYLPARRVLRVDPVQALRMD